ncbi:hypothetical protein N6H14_07890 [Paenibacillus sp. CC-CFT747]|nr:hypothetical protein N6H14_07890 [Paenibacillus sp. CC-CFT747]
MARMEYRKLEDGFPVLYHYASITPDEISLRFACDYLVKEGKVYEKTSCAAEDGCYVVYVKESTEEKAIPGASSRPSWRGIRVELRKFDEFARHYPVLHHWDFDRFEEALLQLQSNYVYWGDKEWERTSTEVDEDRKLYVIYAQEAIPYEGQRY